MMVMHPESFRLLRDTLAREHGGITTSPSPDRGGSTKPSLDRLLGERIYTSVYVPKHPTVWRFPVERYWIYEPSDEEWCRPLGIGYEAIDLDSLLILHVADMASPRFM